MENKLNQSVDSTYFKTLADVVEFQANQQIMLNEPQNMVDDEAVTRYMFAPKTKEASRLDKLHNLSDAVEERYQQLHKEIYGVAVGQR